MSHYVWIAPLVALALSQVAVIATSVYLHRGLAHRAIRVHPAMDVCFRAVLWITTGQSRREWVAVHRKHHAFTDRPGDPHSPRLLGFWRVQLLNVYYYIREARNQETIRTFARDIVDDRLDRVLFSRGLSGVALGIALLCLVLGVWAGLTAGLTHAVLYVFVLAPLINGLGHWRGDQNFSGNTAYNWTGGGLGDGWGRAAQQSSRVPERPEVQHAAVRVRSVVGRDPRARRGRAGRDRRHARRAR